MTMLDESAARSLLPHTWHAFFGRFGRLTETQAVSIGPISAGKSAILCAPTASGKTEAIVAPLIERMIHIDRKAPGPRILVICPTRALCNDLHRRIQRPVSACGWTSDIKTGDSPSFSDDDPPKVLVTTPESFDSLLSRRPAALRHVDALFLDELHLLDGSARGDHLRALVFRLMSFRKDLQICAASATAADSERLAKEYTRQGAVVLRAGGGRDRRLDAKLIEVATLPDAAQVIRWQMDEEPGSKILVFANTRAEVEWLAADLTDLQAFAHHGSLARGERLRAEEGFLRTASGVCVATMTLELGVDIGDVDRVMLINPPPNVASFTQRIGRSNRRGGRIQTTCLFSSPFDRSRFEHLIDCAEEGRLFPEAIAFRPSVIAQQAVSLLFQNPEGWVTAKALHARLPPKVRQSWTQADCAKILKSMRDEGYLHADSRGHYVADEAAQKDYRYGRIHAHIDSSGEVEVVDEATGRKIGTALWSSDDQRRGQGTGGGMLLGGQHRKVTRVVDGQVFVEGAKGGEEAQFLSRMGPRYSFELARDLASHLGQQEGELVLRLAGDRRWRMEHFFGTLWGQLLAATMRQRKFKLKKVTAFFAECSLRSGSLPETLGSAEEIEADLRKWLSEDYKNFLKPLGAGPWRRFVPPELLRRWVIECVRPAEFAETIARFRIVEVDH